MVLSLPSALAVTEKVCSEADLETLSTEMAMAQEGKRTFTLGGYVTGKKSGSSLKRVMRNILMRMTTNTDGAIKARPGYAPSLLN